jgi:hypothetical protein
MKCNLCDVLPVSCNLVSSSVFHTMNCNLPYFLSKICNLVSPLRTETLYPHPELQPLFFLSILCNLMLSFP